MSGRRSAPRVFVVGAVLTMVTAVVGFAVALILHLFVFDKFNAYGEVPIPGSGRLDLPAGEVTISFHTYVTGSGGAGLPVPQLSLGIVPPDGVAEPQVTESIGSTTTVNNDARVRVWVAEIPEAGTYRITTDGAVNGYISPRLAFGHGSQYGWLVWVFVGLFALGVVELVFSLMWAAAAGRRPVPIQGVTGFGTPGDLGSYTPTDHDSSPPADPGSYTPTDHGVRIEQLKNLAALRDCGALTEAEFEAEKRRILDG